MRKQIALVAHDNRKKDLLEWVEWNAEKLLRHDLICTGTTGHLIEQGLKQFIEQGKLKNRELNLSKLKSGPLGGDQQLGAMIAENKIDAMIFFWDPMQAQPHDVDVKALLRLATLYNIPTAINRSTADFIISSPLFNEPYQRKLKNYSEYLKRRIDDL
jgi:methylglyoxal synthase